LPNACPLACEKNSTVVITIFVETYSYVFWATLVNANSIGIDRKKNALPASLGPTAVIAYWETGCFRSPRKRGE